MVLLYTDGSPLHLNQELRPGPSSLSSNTKLLFLGKITMVGLSSLVCKMKTAPILLFSQINPKEPQKHNNGWGKEVAQNTIYYKVAHF